MQNHPDFQAIPQFGKRLSIERIQSLLVDPAEHPRGLAYLSAASGLVRVRQRLYVVADDELHLGIFEEATAMEPKPSSDREVAGELVRLLDGDLPKDAGKRKKAKPDFESLALLPRLPGCPAGAFLALGSGSKPNREMAVMLALDVHGMPNGRMAQIDLAAVYAPLRKRFLDLNIERALVVSGELLLLQRGNKGSAPNACIRFDWNLFALWLAGKQAHPAAAKSVQYMDLGAVDGVPLGFTDGAALHGGAWAITAVAENTDNSYEDGACVASVIGTVGADGNIQKMYPLEGAPKVEGLAALADSGDWIFTLVTDADDPTTAAQLLQVRLPT